MEKNLPYRIMQIGINFKSQVHIWYGFKTTLKKRWKNYSLHPSILVHICFMIAVQECWESVYKQFT